MSDRTPSTINRIVELFAAAFEGLSVGVPMTGIEELAGIVHRSMDQGRRRYHRTPHVFEVCRGMPPRPALAALFHDVVYVPLDGELPRQTLSLLQPLLDVVRESITLRESALEDPTVAMVAELFRVRPGYALDVPDGINEFLSALVAAKALEPYLPTADLLRIVAAIEATIPFRSQAGADAEQLQGLAVRVRAAAGALGLDWSKDDVHTCMRDAVLVANRDVAGFAVADPGQFLAATWLLIEESNAPLAAVGVYSIEEYRMALVRMEKFLRGLEPTSVFHRYADSPPANEHAAMCAAAGRNLEFACRYLGIKILGIAIVEAIARATGGNCPVSMLLGDIRTVDGDPEQIGDYLPAASRDAAVDAELLRMLERGRAWESQADLNTSPLSAFVYQELGADRTDSAIVDARRMFEGKLDPEVFLAGLPAAPVAAVIAACSRIAVSRRGPLTVLAERLRR